MSIDRFKGTMLGCAVGDALGSPLDGMSAEAIAGEFGRVTDFPESRYGIGAITSDTQVTISIAQAITEMGPFDRDHTAFKLGTLFRTDEKGLKEVRSPGEATLKAGRSLAGGAGADGSGVPSAGCGAAVRACAVGLGYFHDPQALLAAAVGQASITHTSEDAQAGAAAVAIAVACGVGDGGELDRDSFAQRVAGFIAPVSGALADKVAGLAAFLEAPLENGLAFTGSSGYVMEAVPAALLFFLRSPDDFEESVISAVNAGGCPGSIAAMTGAVSGAFNGEAGIPGRWLSRVEGRSYIEGLCERLWTLTPAYRPRKRPML